MPTKHLNLLALPFFIYRSLRTVIYFLVVALFSWHWAYLIGMFGWALLSGTWRYIMFRYALGDDELYIRRGFFFKKEHHVPYDRIQNVQRNQWFFLKPFHVEELVIDTGAQTAKDEKLFLPMVKEQVATALNQHRNAVHQTAEVISNDELTSERHPSEDVAPIDAQYRIKWADLFIFAVTNFNILVELGFLYSAFYRLHLDRILQNHLKGLEGQLVHAGVVLISGLVFFILILMMLINIVQAAIKYYHFTLTRQGNNLTIEKGFFQRSTIHVPTDKIQGIELKQTWLRQLFHLVSVKVDLIADQRSKDDGGAITLLPVVSDLTVYQNVHRFIARMPDEPLNLKRGDAYMMWLFARNGILIVLPFLVIITGIIGHYSWYLSLIILILLIILVAINGIYKGARTSLHQVNQQQIMLRTSKRMRSDTLIIDWHKIQSMRIRQSIWMKKRHRMHLEVMVRSGNDAKQFSCRYLPADEVQNVFDWYRHFA